LEFFFGDSLTWDDVFDGHNAVILPLSRLPQGGEAKTSSNKTLTWKIVTAITRPAPFPACPEPVEGWEGQGDRRCAELVEASHAHLLPNLFPIPILPQTSLGF